VSLHDTVGVTIPGGKGLHRPQVFPAWLPLTCCDVLTSLASSVGRRHRGGDRSISEIRAEIFWREPALADASGLAPNGWAFVSARIANHGRLSFRRQ
jgi:hypothetical protein